MSVLNSNRHASESGFSLIELMISMGILLAVSSIVMGGVMNLTQLNTTVTNRSDMFAAVRNASSLLQQEVGQAGRITLPGDPLLAANVAAGVQTVAVTSDAGMFVGEWLDIDTGNTRETVQLTAVAGGTITANFTMAHAVDAPLSVAGGFSAGVVPPAVSLNAAVPNFADGSTPDTLKIFGDINGNRNMVYVEYRCDTVNRQLTRNSMAFDEDKEEPGPEQVLVDNLLANPNATPCFTYQTKAVSGTPFVVGVAITITVESREVDPVTKARQRESKALLMVSPRNVFNVWQMASLGVTNRVQPMPALVVNLLPAL
jgi:prepilin-type N-terminal cleavage/methylation domain-containing protein